MHSDRLWSYISLLWTVFTIYFAISVRKVGIKRSSALSLYSLETFGALMAGLLVLWPETHISVLALPFNDDFGIELLGFCMTVVGLSFSAWARDVLGKNWSSRPMILTDHELVTAGPYAYLRHPLYTGILVALAGSALASSEYGALLGWTSLAAIFAVKAHREERLLESEFGARYLQYRSRTGFLLPRIAHV